MRPLTQRRKWTGYMMPWTDTTARACAAARWRVAENPSRHELPDEEQKAERWQAAAEVLLHAAEHGDGWLEFVHIGLMRALSTEEEQYGPGSAWQRIRSGDGVD